MNLREAAKMALEALEEYEKSYQAVADGLKPLRAALAEEVMQRLTDVQQEMEATINEMETVEPVAYSYPDARGRTVLVSTTTAPYEDAKPLYTAPPKREPLTESFLEELAEKHVTHCYFDTLTYAREIERLHGIGGEK